METLKFTYVHISKLLSIDVVLVTLGFDPTVDQKMSLDLTNAHF